jgi:hypothetical protein
MAVNYCNDHEQVTIIINHGSRPPLELVKMRHESSIK